MRVRLIGLGRWGEKHLRVLGELGVELRVADVSAERRAFAVEAGVVPARAVEDFRHALPHVDAVDIVTPADNHLDGRARYCTGRFAGFERPRADVGVTQTDAIHHFDLFAYLLEREATAVTATLRDYLGRGVDDCSFTTVEYGDVPTFVEAGYFAPGAYQDCVIVGEHATLDADFGTLAVRVLANRHVETDVHAGLGAMCTVEAAQRSSALGRRVSLAEIA